MFWLNFWGVALKGVVFTEFYEFVETEFSPVFLQETINSVPLSTNGVYTATGTYPCQELVLITETIAQKSGLAMPGLLKAFGRYMFKYFTITAPEHFKAANNSYDFMTRVENVIHLEVRKLYPDAELPNFDFIERSDKHYVMTYTSARQLGDFCEGLMLATLDYYGENARLSRRILQSSPMTKIEFRVDYPE